MFKETFNGNLITIERWPSSTTEIKGKFSKSLNSLCNKNMKSLSNISSFSLINSFPSSLSSIYSSNNDIMEILNDSFQESLLHIIEEEE